MRGPWSDRARLGAWGRWPRLLRQRPRAIVNAVAIALPPVRVNRARDIRIVQDILIRSNRAVWLGEDIASVKPAPLEDLNRAVARVKALFDAAEGQERSGEGASATAAAMAGPSASRGNAMTGTA
jgi:hypothetical protein